MFPSLFKSAKIYWQREEGRYLMGLMASFFNVVVSSNVVVNLADVL